MAEFLRWPAWMPLPQQEQYSYEPTDRRTRTDMEVGSILRVNFDTDETTVTCSLILNEIQAAWFENFERAVLAQGSRWFKIPLQSSGKVLWHTARFKSRPKASTYGPRYTTYSLTLEIEKRPEVLCPQLIAFITCASPDALCKSASDLTHGLHDYAAAIELPDFWAPRTAEAA